MQLRLLNNFLLPILTSSHSFAQNHRLTPYEDSILKIISNSDSDTTKAKYYNEMALELRRNNPEQTVNYGTKALEIYKKQNIPLGVAKSYLYIGTGYLNLSKHAEAVDCFKKAVIWGVKAGDKKTIARAYNNTGIVFIKQGNNPEALKYYLLTKQL